jgi:hypothetical protein
MTSNQTGSQESRILIQNDRASEYEKILDMNSAALPNSAVDSKGGESVLPMQLTRANMFITNPNDM